MTTAEFRALFRQRMGVFRRCRLRDGGVLSFNGVTLRVCEFEALIAVADEAECVCGETTDECAVCALARLEPAKWCQPEHYERGVLVPATEIPA